MNQIAKKLLLCVGILSVTMVSGCSSDDSSKKKETAKNEEKAEVKMVANDLYVEPLNPTQAQIEAYNKLSQAITSEDRKEEATMVAVSFAFHGVCTGILLWKLSDHRKRIREEKPAGGIRL